jgi:hypothetical protein
MKKKSTNEERKTYLWLVAVVLAFGFFWSAVTPVLPSGLSSQRSNIKGYASDVLSGEECGCPPFSEPYDNYYNECYENGGEIEVLTYEAELCGRTIECTMPVCY